MTGILVSKSRYQNSKTLSLSPSLENRVAKVFQQRSWLNDLSLPLLLMLAGSLASRPAHAQQETPLNEIAVTAQNQFGTASQLLIKDGVLYLIEDGCNLVMIRWMAALVLIRWMAGLVLTRWMAALVLTRWMAARIRCVIRLRAGLATIYLL